MSGARLRARSTNCGGCGIVCASDEICDRGRCTCAPGTADCGDGFCGSVLNDANNCGACGNVCGGDTPTCDKGICVGTCLSVDLADCGSECVDLMWNDRNCGACGRVCGGGDGTLYCEYGECVTCAAAGRADCDGFCAELMWSESHCGACDRSCAPGQACVFGECVAGDGTCVSSCPDDDICCNGTCVNPRTSDHHCGGCGVDMCAGGCTEACRDGECQPVDCGGGDD